MKSSLRRCCATLLPILCVTVAADASARPRAPQRSGQQQQQQAPQTVAQQPIAQQNRQACPVTHEALVAALKRSVAASGGQSNGGFDNHMWGAVVDRAGVVCAVAHSGADWREQWLGSRIIAINKAGTALAFSLDKKAMATANLYVAAQPGGFLYGLAALRRPGQDAPAQVAPAQFGTPNDPQIGHKTEGVIVFGGGLALYDDTGLVGGLGLSGDSSCADHNVAWRTRQALGLDRVPAGPAASNKDAIIFDLNEAGESLSGFGHPKCVGKEAAVAVDIGAGVGGGVLP